MFVPANLELYGQHAQHIVIFFPVFYRYTFASGSADNIKQWMFPDGNFIQNLSGHNAIINTLAVNSDGVLVSGGNHKQLVLLILFIWVDVVC